MNDAEEWEKLDLAMEALKSQGASEEARFFCEMRGMLYGLANGIALPQERIEDFLTRSEKVAMKISLEGFGVSLEPTLPGEYP